MTRREIFGSEAAVALLLHFCCVKYKANKRTFLSLIFSYGEQGVLTKVHPWVQLILAAVHVCAQGILNKISVRVLSVAGLGYMDASAVSYHCGGKPGSLKQSSEVLDMLDH